MFPTPSFLFSFEDLPSASMSLHTPLIILSFPLFSGHFSPQSQMPLESLQDGYGKHPGPNPHFLGVHSILSAAIPLVC